MVANGGSTLEEFGSKIQNISNTESAKTKKLPPRPVWDVLFDLAVFVIVSLGHIFQVSNALFIISLCYTRH